MVESLGAGKRPAVKIAIRDHLYRTTVAPRGGRFLIPLSAENREAAGVAAGERVEVEIELDTEPREVAVPPDLAKALDAAPAAREAFEELSYSYKKEYARSVTEAKRPETRERRVAKAIHMLLEGR